MWFALRSTSFWIFRAPGFENVSLGRRFEFTVNSRRYSLSPWYLTVTCSSILSTCYVRTLHTPVCGFPPQRQRLRLQQTAFPVIMRCQRFLLHFHHGGTQSSVPLVRLLTLFCKESTTWRVKLGRKLRSSMTRVSHCACPFSPFLHPFLTVAPSFLPLAQAPALRQQLVQTNLPSSSSQKHILVFRKVLVRGGEQRPAAHLRESCGPISRSGWSAERQKLLESGTGSKRCFKDSVRRGPDGLLVFRCVSERRASQWVDAINHAPCRGRHPAGLRLINVAYTVDRSSGLRVDAGRHLLFRR